MEWIRSFIAIELPEEVKTRLTELENSLKASKQPGIKWVDPNGIHLTLKFLSDVAADKVSDVIRAMEEAVQGIPPLHLEVKELGVFPNLKRVQVAWVGVGGEVDRLAELQRRIEATVAPLGYPTEQRPFTAHLTLARVRNEVSPAERMALGQLITSTKFEGGTFTADAVSLMKSQLTRTGAIYSRIAMARLK